MSWFTTTTGARIGQLLDGIDFNDPDFRQGGWTTSNTRRATLDTGDSITAPNAEGDKSSLALVQELLEAERGTFYVSKDGKATYEERASRARRTTSLVTITTAALRSEPGFEFDSLINRQKVTREVITSGAGTTPNVTSTVPPDATPQVAQNAVSVKTFGVQDGSDITSVYLGSDAAALSLAQFIVNIRSSFAAPVVVEMDGGDRGTTLQMMALELQDRVTVSDTVAGTSGDYVIEGIEIEVSEGGNRYVTTFTLSEYGLPPFVFDDTSFGVFAPPDDIVTYSTCVSTARPGSPSNGDYILETDTGRYFKRVAGAWVEQIYPRLTY